MHLVFNGNCREAMNCYAELCLVRESCMLTHRRDPCSQRGSTRVPGVEHPFRRSRSAAIPSWRRHDEVDCYQPPQGHWVQLQLRPKAQDSAARVLINATGGSCKCPPTDLLGEGFGMLTDRFGIAWMLELPGLHPLRTCTQNNGCLQHLNRLGLNLVFGIETWYRKKGETMKYLGLVLLFRKA